MFLNEIKLAFMPLFFIMHMAVKKDIDSLLDSIDSWDAIVRIKILRRNDTLRSKLKCLRLSPNKTSTN